MKKISISLTGLALLSLAACNETPKTPAAVTPKTWEFKITNQTTKHILDSVVAAWKNDSINLSFSNIVTDSSGKIAIISGAVDLKLVGGHVSGSFKNDTLSKAPEHIILTNKPTLTLESN